MVKFAQMENKLGDKERAQTLFEQILNSYPKRVDVWSSYVDTLVKSEQLDIARYCIYLKTKLYSASIFVVHCCFFFSFSTLPEKYWRKQWFNNYQHER